MNEMHPELRRRLRATGPLPVPPPPPGLASRVLAVARQREVADADVAPEPFLMAAAGLAFVVAVAGLVFWNVPGQGSGPAPDLIEATQFVFTQFLP